MPIFFKLFAWFAVVVLGLLAFIFIAGQLGFLHGTTPTDLGVKDGRLKPPSQTPNSASSQTGLYPDHPQAAYASVEPLVYTGDATAAMDKLARVVAQTEGCIVVKREGNYLYAQCSTQMLRFTDDLELWADPAKSVVQVRSASRLGYGDHGVNRARVEAIRAAFKP